MPPKPKKASEAVAVGHVQQIKTCGKVNDEVALGLLRRIASLVKPIMTKHNWTLPLLREFFPEQANLLGLNVNRGREIRIRLRHAHDEKSFLDFESLVGTMLHELTHNVHGPHDAKFYKFLDELTKELEDLMASGWQGEGFDGPGRRVGAGVSHNVSESDRRRAAAEAAAKRAAVSGIMLPAGGKRLGGAGPVVENGRRLTPGELAARAAERRARDNLWCGNRDDAAPDANGGPSAEGEKPKRKRERSGPWTCEVCTLLNDAEATVCEACEADKPTKEAAPEPKPLLPPTIPEQRTSKKKIEREVQILPRSVQRGLESRKTETEKTSWSCNSCTLVNKAAAVNCEACGIERPEISIKLSEDGAVVLVQAGVWICPSCEAETGTDFRMCRACGFMRML